MREQKATSLQLQMHISSGWPNIKQEYKRTKKKGGILPRRPTANGQPARQSDKQQPIKPARYFNEDYEDVIKLGDDLNSVHLFKNSESRIVYAWSLALTDNKEKAEEVFKDMDANFSNYVHRSEYAKFLIEQNRAVEAKEILNNLEQEISHMEPGEQRRKKPIRREIKSLIQSIG